MTGIAACYGLFIGAALILLVLAWALWMAEGE
jgi:hypothetical protein